MSQDIFDLSIVSLSFCIFLQEDLATIIYNNHIILYFCHENFVFFPISYRLIKMSSPMINNIIVIGSILCYTAVILHGLDTRLIQKVYISSMCNVSIHLFYHCVSMSASFPEPVYSKITAIYLISSQMQYVDKVA